MSAVSSPRPCLGRHSKQAPIAGCLACPRSYRAELTGVGKGAGEGAVDDGDTIEPVVDPLLAGGAGKGSLVIGVG
ncbi:MAG: hypothetical protein ACT4QC_22670 [Planctomycetaceae bacterium]